MAPLSFEPAAEASYKNGIFSQYAAKLLGKVNFNSNCLHGWLSQMFLKCLTLAEKPMENPQEEVTTHVNKR